MAFSDNLTTVLEALPTWRRMRAARKRANRLASQQVGAPVAEPPAKPESSRVAPTDERGLRKTKPWQVSDEVRLQIQSIKQNIENSLAVIAKIIPDVRPDVEYALDHLLFPGLTANLASVSESMAGDTTEILQREWLRVLENIEALEKVIPGGSALAAIRQNLRTFRDYLRRTVGRAIFRNPAGSLR